MKVWNITDDPRSEHLMEPLVLFGKKVAPGKSVVVPDAVWAKALKSLKAEKEGFLFAGDKLPAEYLVATGRMKAKFAKGGVRTHGITPGTMAKLGPAVKPDVPAPETTEKSEDRPQLNGRRKPRFQMKDSE